MGSIVRARRAPANRARRSRSAALASAVAFLLVPAAGGGSPPAAWPPPTLRDTGLYSDWATKTVARRNLPFSPQYPLWTDGARKLRWLSLPPGSFIDASNPDVWRFPIGTRVWKEFSFGRRAETRFIEHTRTGWQFATYVWNDEETEAPLAPEKGIAQSVLIRDRIRHAIPSRIDCRACHEAGAVRLLGVSALQLSADRDPHAPHTERPPAGAVDLPWLVERRLVRGLPSRLLRTPARVEAPSPVARAALGYLHANCGSCHTGLGELASLKFALNYPLAPPSGDLPPAVLTSVNRPSTFRVPATTDRVDRISPGHPEASVLVARMSSRHPVLQMPPLGSRIVDEEAVALVRRWIAEDLGQTGEDVTTSEEKQ